MSSVNSFLQLGDVVENFTTTNPSPWTKTIINTEVSSENKDDAAVKHRIKAAQLRKSDINLLLYTDRSKVNSNIRVAFMSFDSNFGSFTL